MKIDGAKLKPFVIDKTSPFAHPYFWLNDFQGAVDSFRQATNLLPGDATAQYYLGVALMAQGERKAARKQVKKLRELGANEFANELSQKIPQ